MRFRDRRRRVLGIALALLVVGVSAYPVGLRCWSVYHHRSAQHALEQRDFRQAQLHLQKCLEARPEDPAARLLAAQTARRQGNYSLALEHLRRCRQSGSPQAVLDLEYQLIRVQQGNLEEAERLRARCIDQPTDEETPLILEALIEGHLRSLFRDVVRERDSPGREQRVDVTPARQVVDLWCRQYTRRADQVQGLVWHGLLQSLMRDYAQAEADFRAALALDPTHVQASWSLAQLLARESPEKAAALLQELRRRDPGNSTVGVQLATIRRNLGQLKDARQILDEVLSADPDNVAALLERGRVAHDERQFADAERWLRRVLTLAPNRVEALLTLSQCLYQMDRTTEAKHLQERFEQVKTAVQRGQNPSSHE